MAAIDHWHPVLAASRLRRKPVPVRVAGGHEIVLFRTRAGKLAALRDQCPHRRMRLSFGRVAGERLVCPYHGWNFDERGDGCAPSSPNLRSCVTRYDVAERYGAIWVKSAESSARLPEFGGPQYRQLFYLRYLIGAPLELVIDNFAEIEHSVTTHVLLAHDADGIAKTECHVDIEDDLVRVTNTGPQKRVFEPFRWLLGYGEDDLFVGEGTIRFSPVYLELKNYWLDRERVTRKPTRVTGTVVFNPVSHDETEIHLFGFGAHGDGAIAWLLKRAFLTGVIHVETLLDKRMMGRIADKNPAVEGMKLGRFDRPLYAIRERLKRLYWGDQGAPTDRPIPLSSRRAGVSPPPQGHDDADAATSA